MRSPSPSSALASPAPHLFYRSAIDVANFVVISSGTVRVQTGGDIDRGLLTYSINPALPESLTYTMALNGTVVVTRTAETNIRHVDHEVVSGFGVGTNTLRILITGGTGGLAFGEIVLNYKRLV